MTDIRTPDDEVDKLDYYYPPFREDWWYLGATYGGHSDFSVDWNRRTKLGGWLDDLGDPVLAAAAGTVLEIDKPTGTVYVGHWGGLRRTEYRHMRTITVKVTEKVQRGDKLGEIGAEGIDTSTAPGGVASPHLHHVHWKRSRVSDSWERCKQSFYGKPIEASVWNSDSRPPGENLPGPVMLQGPPTRATWESAYRDAMKALTKTEAKLTASQLEAATAKAAADELSAALVETKAQLAACQNTLPDCSAIAAELEQTKQALAEETDRAIVAENIVDVVRRAVAV